MYDIFQSTVAKITKTERLCVSFIRDLTFCCLSCKTPSETLTLADALTFLFPFQGVRLIAGHYSNVGIRMVRTLATVEMKGGFKRIFHKKKLINPYNPRGRERMTQTFQARLPENRITDDIKTVKGRGNWRREVTNSFFLNLICGSCVKRALSASAELHLVRSDD